MLQEGKPEEIQKKSEKTEPPTGPDKYITQLSESHFKVACHIFVINNEG